MQKLRGLLLLAIGAFMFWGVVILVHKSNERDQKFLEKMRERDRKETAMAQAWEESCEKRPGVVISVQANRRFCFAQGVILDTEER